LDPLDDADVGPEPPKPGFDNDDEVLTDHHYGRAIDPIYDSDEMRTRQDILTEFCITEEVDINDLPPDIVAGTETRTPNDIRVPGACMLTSFVPLQLIAHAEEGRGNGKPIIIFDNELCNSVVSGTDCLFSVDITIIKTT
jgi:hypothetical protein